MGAQKLAVITGATGLVGANLAEALLAAGHRVRCTKRATSNTSHLDGMDVEWVEATLGDVAALTAAFQGADVVFHCAAAVSILKAVTPELVASNVDGTRHVIEAMRASGAGRLVHCSSTVAVGMSEDGAPCDEAAPWNFDRYGLDDGYSITKRDSEALVREAVAQGLDAVIVNPGYMFGPYDQRPSSGTLLIDLIRGKIPGFSAGKNCFVDVRDVCQGMILAWERGETGERYILGGDNLTYKELMIRASAVAGVKPPRFSIPRPAAWCFGLLGDIGQKITGREAALNTNTIAWGYTDRFIFSSDKARRELGYTTRPVEDGIQAALDWFRANGMLPPS